MSKTEIGFNIIDPKAQQSYKLKSQKKVFNPEFLKSIIDGIPLEGSFLDAGCGHGFFLKQLREYAENNGRGDIGFFAFDSAQYMVDSCKETNPDIAHNIFQENLLEFSQDFARQKFDYVFSRMVLFFFRDDQRGQVFNNLRDITKEGGTLDIQVREKRYDTNYPHRTFNDYRETDLRKCFIENGFDITRSVISEDKIPFRAAGQNNLDNFYNKLRVTGTYVGMDNVKPNPRVETFKEDRDLSKRNQQVQRGSLSVAELLRNDGVNGR